MSTIITIQATDLISDSRADINTNFSNLNTDKIEIGGVNGTQARGDIIVGKNASPTWEKLTIGAANTILVSDGTEVSWSAAATIGTSLTTPLVIGGTGTTSTLKLRSTSGVGATGADIIFQVGNNGATEAMRILNSGKILAGATNLASYGADFVVANSGSADQEVLIIASEQTAANNNSAYINFKLKDDDDDAAGTISDYGFLKCIATDVTNSSRDTKFELLGWVANSWTSFMTIGAGIVVGAPTGGDKGAGTLNATAVYDDNVLLTDYVFDKYFDNKVKDEDIKQRGNYTMLSLNEMTKFIEINRHLPTMVGRDEWKKRGKLSHGELITQLWETVETQALYIKELSERGWKK